MAAALPGVVAAHTTRPVIGVPIAVRRPRAAWTRCSRSSQMPPNVPVACVAVNGARNAGLLAVQIVAASDDAVAKAFAEFKRKLAEG